VDLLEENILALDIWNKIQAVGPELAWRMLDLKLTQAEAEDLLEKLSFISSVIRRWEREKAESEKGSR
jgi:hypothetical protein